MSLFVNSASYDELRTLPTIGDKKATILLKFREKYGCLTKGIMERALGGTPIGSIVRFY